MANYPLPNPARVNDLLGMLFDGLDVKPGGAFDAKPTGGAYFGVFVADNDTPVALCGADAALAASLGAALSMLPPGVAKEAAKSKELTPVMIDNVREVMNICSRLLMDDSSSHLKLSQVYPANSLPPSAGGLLGTKDRREFTLQVPKYGGGVLTVIAS